MKINLRRILFTSGLIVILAAISIVCLIFGRGHTVYFDNKSIEGTNYSAYTSIDIIYKGEKIVNLGKADRGSIALTGQKLDVSFAVKKTKSAQEQIIDVTYDIPYDLDGIIINLPAYFEGAEEDVYMSEFVPVRTEEEDANEEVPVTDEFGLVTEEE